MKRFHILLDDEDFEWLTEVSQRNETPVSELVRKAIAQYRALAERETLYPDSAQPSDHENSDEGIRKRLSKLEAYVFEVLAHSHGVYNRAVMEIPDYAPSYLLGRPDPD
jgi:hypothetical protein